MRTCGHPETSIRQDKEGTAYCADCQRELSQLDTIKRKIIFARAQAKHVQESRARLAGVLSGAYGVVGVELELPEPDIMHVYQCMFGRRVGEPVVYRLSFGKQLRWVGISYPWGVKPADIICDDESGA